MAEEEGGAEDTSFLRTVSSQYLAGRYLCRTSVQPGDLADSFAGVDKFPSSALLTINSGRDDSGGGGGGGYKCFHFGLSGLTQHGVSRTNDCLVAE